MHEASYIEQNPVGKNRLNRTKVALISRPVATIQFFFVRIQQCQVVAAATGRLRAIL